MISKHPADVPKDSISEADEGEIISRVLGGEINAFELLVVKYGAYVRAIVARHVPLDRVSEVSQDVFVSAYRTLSSYSGRSGFKQWLSRITVRRCCDFWREQERKKETPFSQLTEDQVNWLEANAAEENAEKAESAARQVEAIEILDSALARLSPEDRTALTLVYLDGVSVKVAADLLGWSSILLRVRVHRAKKALRRIISELLEMRADDEEK